MIIHYLNGNRNDNEAVSILSSKCRAHQRMTIEYPLNKVYFWEFQPTQNAMCDGKGFQLMFQFGLLPFTSFMIERHPDRDIEHVKYFHCTKNIICTGKMHSITQNRFSELHNSVHRIASLSIHLIF